ncbi:hypothetical protein KsCSTR_43860 [Candidatus Kuenenia stuttgartiensis]|uniref:Uncharacterized protein n=1 Tax=Kuenenia stuttgartiensis TaxID=174633 RepID=Q1PWZ1_KUEST|nr:hypothetical protein KsCSTR_43860 [Candidatus Kuenenia stuttgartiensis]CAJ71753.1 unknown protein [Candidatus Kuenenia stuttgartiensis]
MKIEDCFRACLALAMPAGSGLYTYINWLVAIILYNVVFRPLVRIKNAKYSIYDFKALIFIFS